jgi:hypothetical protein
MLFSNNLVKITLFMYKNAFRCVFQMLYVIIYNLINTNRLHNTFRNGEHAVANSGFDVKFDTQLVDYSFKFEVVLNFCR